MGVLWDRKLVNYLSFICEKKKKKKGERCSMMSGTGERGLGFRGDLV